MEFYPLIGEGLFLNAINFAKRYITIEPETIDLNLCSRKLLHFDSSSTCINKDSNLFDVTMGSYDGAEICELVDLFLLHELNALVAGREGSLGLFRDDGLAAVYNCTLTYTLFGPAIDCLKKDITKIFQNNGLFE